LSNKMSPTQQITPLTTFLLHIYLNQFCP